MSAPVTTFRCWSGCTPIASGAPSPRCSGPTSTLRHTGVGIDTKVLAGAVFAEIVADGRLAEDIHALARHAGIGADWLAKAAAFAGGDDAALPADHPAGSALILARAASYSPARIDSTAIAACRQGDLSAAAIIEVITWLAVLQMLHRLTCFTFIAE